MFVPPVAGVIWVPLTVWDRLADVLGLKLVLPEWAAATVWLAAVSELLVARVAVPPERVTAPPKLVPSMVNWTVPEGVPLPGAEALTVAVKVTGSPASDG